MYELPGIRHAFDLTEDQNMIREMVTEFAQNALVCFDGERHFRIIHHGFSLIVTACRVKAQI